MWFSKKTADKPAAGGTVAEAGSAPSGESPAPGRQITTKARGDAAEALALAHLQNAGLRHVQSNYRTPGRGGGEIDLVMSHADGTLVFVEVRQRSGASHGGAGASISPGKQRRIELAARHYLRRYATLPPCRFDVVLIEGAIKDANKEGNSAGHSVQVTWIKAAFDASAGF